MVSATDQFINSEVRDGVASVTLNRPPVNVLNIAMLRQLGETLTTLAGETTARALILRAEGKLFSAGVDVADHTPDRVGEMIPLFDQVCRALVEFPVPTIAAVNGHALGGGCELVQCCDLAVMADTAQIGQPEIQLGAMAPIAILRLPHLVGYRAAADLLFSGSRIDAAQAQRLGMINAVMPPQQVEQWAQDKARELARLSRAALALNKQALRTSFDGWAKTLEAIEQLYLHDLMSTADAQEGLAAFLEKRSPVWKHH